MPDSVEIWYLTPYGHANRPIHAIKDRFGNPLISPGPVKNILKLIERNHRKAHKQIWEDLLDVMEEIDDSRGEGWGENDKDVAKLLGKGEALVRTLAILEYGNEFREDPDAAYALVTTKALSMFED